MPVVWREALSVHNHQIDHDHKYLLCLFNAIELCLANRESVTQLPLFFDQLLEYTREHFDREERLQIKLKYPGYVEHKICHQQLIDRLEQVRERLDVLRPGEPPAPVDDAALETLRSEVLDLAREWIVDHIVRTDRKLGDYLKRLPPEYRQPAEQ